MYERLFFGFKTLIFPIGWMNSFIKESSFFNIVISADEKELIFNIKKNINLFKLLGLKNNKNELRTDISNILLDIKEDAIEKYNINVIIYKFFLGIIGYIKDKTVNTSNINPFLI